MPRTPRLQFENAFYHVFHRGNRRERIFRDSADYAHFEQMMLEAMRRSNVFLYTWKLMPNHFHMAIETPDANIAEFMQRLLTRYACYFNKRYKLVGHVFQGRYGSRVCDKEAYFKELIRYIQLNAYRTKGTPLAKIGEWKWSSHRYHIGLEPPPEGTETAFNRLLEHFGSTPEQARKNYAQFLADRLRFGTGIDFYKVKDHRFIGNDAFVEKVKRSSREPVRAHERHCRSLRDVLELVKVIEVLGGPSRDALADENRRPNLSHWRQALVYVARRYYRFRVVDIARVLGRDHTSVSQILRRLRGREKDIPEIEKLTRALEDTL